MSSSHAHCPKSSTSTHKRHGACMNAPSLWWGLETLSRQGVGVIRGLALFEDSIPNTAWHPAPQNYCFPSSVRFLLLFETAGRVWTLSLYLAGKSCGEWDICIVSKYLTTKHRPITKRKRVTTQKSLADIGLIKGSEQTSSEVGHIGILWHFMTKALNWEHQDHSFPSATVLPNLNLITREHQTNSNWKTFYNTIDLWTV